MSGELQTIPSSDGGILAVIARAAADPTCDVDKLDRMLAMHERVMAKQAEVAFNVAMNKAQSEIGRVVADKSNSQTSSKYASEAALDRALRPVYSRNGFSLSFNSGKSETDSFVKVICYCAHAEGHTRTYEIDMPADGKGAKGNDVMTKTHATGSGLSYGKRYLLKLIFNVAIGDDDDGNAAGGIAYITEEQATELNRLIAIIGESERPAFLKYMDCPTVPHIQAKSYAKALKALNQKVKAVAA